MIIHTVVGEKNLPPNAVKMTEEEVLKHQTNLVNKWRYSSDV